MNFNMTREKIQQCYRSNGRSYPESSRRIWDVHATPKSLLTCLVLLLAACATVTTTPQSETAESRMAGATATSPLSASRNNADLERFEQLWEKRRLDQSGGDYPLGPGDVIEVNVAGVEEIKNLIERITGEGTLVLPFVGTIHVNGMTDKALRAEIRRRLEKDYVRNPQVNLFVKEYRSRQVAVIGAVQKPGLYNLASSSDTVLGMISQAGGIAPTAAERVLFIPAEPAEPEKAREIIAAMPARLLTRNPAPLILKNVEPLVISLDDLTRSGREKYLNMPVRPGDIVMIPGAGEVLVQGWVARPGSYKITAGLTILGAVAAAGGAGFPADTNAVELIRTNLAGHKSKLVADLEAISNGSQPDISLREGDVVDVVPSNTKLFAYGFYRVLSTLVHVGASANIPIR